MKIKNYSFAVVILLALIGWSCSDQINQEMDTMEVGLQDPTYEQAIAFWRELDDLAGNSNGYRLGTSYNYFETFENQLFFVPAEGFQGGPAPGFYPGRGLGNATRMGKAQSFVNQFAFFDGNELTTIGAPVSKFFNDELLALGIANLPDDVSSITIDKQGNSLWVKNIKNTVTPVNENLSSFIAEVEFIGGTGRFAKFKGTGVVRGNFDPLTGEGSSVTLGDLKNFK